MLKEIERNRIATSTANPRTHFDQEKLDELARSIAEKGILEPVLVRPHSNGGTADYELVAGERRFRAATMADVSLIPCIVRELTDVEALEVQTIENLQREDLHPLEEARGFAALMKEAGYDVAQIAGRISKSERYVYDRIKLLQLIPGLQEVFSSGEISVGHAILLARLNSEDQERALGGTSQNSWNLDGLWQPDLGREEPGLELDDVPKRKAVSVRELQKWIDNQVRFRPEEVDLPNLFPETAAALERAEEEELKVVKITREYRVPDGAKASGERTYGNDHWARADGGPVPKTRWSDETVPSKTCEHSVMGVVVAGPGRGDAFRVCTQKKKCAVHWGDWQKERAKAKKASSSEPSWKQQERENEERRKREEAERERWEKALPQLREAAVEKLTIVPPEDVVGIVIDRLRPQNEWERREQGEDAIERGNGLGDAVRYAAYLVIRRELSSRWPTPARIGELLEVLGIDAQAVVDEVAPKPEPAPAEKDPIEEVRAAIEKALEENPKAELDDLLDVARAVDPEAVEGLTRRQFNARYVLPVWRKRKAAGGKPKKRASRKKKASA